MVGFKGHPCLLLAMKYYPLRWKRGGVDEVDESGKSADGDEIAMKLGFDTNELIIVDWGWDGKVRRTNFAQTIKFEHPEFNLIIQNHELPQVYQEWVV